MDDQDHPYNLLKENFMITGKEDAVSTAPDATDRKLEEADMRYLNDEELATRRANECASTLLAYYAAVRAAVLNSEACELEWLACEMAWSDHKDALDRYERLSPRLDDWERLAHPNLMRAIEAHHQLVARSQRDRS